MPTTQSKGVPNIRPLPGKSSRYLPLLITGREQPLL